MRKLVNGIPVELTQDEIAEIEALRAAPVVVPVPSTISAAQLRIALKRAGKLAATKTLIQGLQADSDERIIIDNERIFRRDSNIIAFLQAGLALTDAEVDDIFVVGASL